MPSLILHPGSTELQKLYEKAFREARELYVVSAYRTTWNTKLPLRANCKFQMIVGRDFGITRKQACRDVLKWLPANQKHNFHVAAYIGGFHPKAIFWTDQEKRHLLVGSSNLTEAAFQSNFEANLYLSADEKTFLSAVDWFERALKKSLVVDENWLDSYKEAKLIGKAGGKRLPVPPELSDDFKIPAIRQRRLAALLKERRRQIKAFTEIRNPLKRLFRDGGALKLSNNEIRTRLLQTWGNHESRFQGKGWERTGAKSDWHIFSKGITDVLNAKESEQDDTVASTIDAFARKKLSTRKALLTEMLCHFLPDKYPIVNGPVRLWINKMNYRAQRGASEGSKFIHLARRMRAILTHSGAQFGNVRIRNLAELDVIIWAKYEKEYRDAIQRYS